jgi:hypothetical protein
MVASDVTSKNWKKEGRQKHLYAKDFCEKIDPNQPDFYKELPTSSPHIKEFLIFFFTFTATL